LTLVVYEIGAVLSASAIASVFAIAFQCGLPHPWAYESGKCFIPVHRPSSLAKTMLTSSQMPFWIPVGAVDIITNIVLIVLPAWRIWGLQMGADKKVIMIAAFGFGFL
jgi:hypothetical protein